MSGNCVGNVPYVNEIATSFPIRCKFKLSIIVKIIIENLASVIGSSTIIVFKTDGIRYSRIRETFFYMPVIFLKPKPSMYNMSC